MPLLEVAATTLGPALAKALINVWLQDNQVGLAVGSSLVEVLGGRIPNVFDRREAARQFEAIGERAARNLMPVFERADLDDGGRIAVARAVADTFATAHITSDSIAAGDIDPQVVARQLLASNPSATLEFSAAETALYERVVAIASEYIVDIASTLPRFAEEVFGELLARQTHLLSLAEEALERLRRMDQISREANPEAAAADFESTYRAAVQRSLDQLELFGTDEVRHPRLSIAFVALDAVKDDESTPTDVAPFELTSVTRVDSRPNSRSEPSQRSKSTSDVLRSASRLIILGPAGLGKTTLLQWVAVRAAAQDVPSILGQLNDKIPFFIVLRKHQEVAFPRPEEFAGLIAPTVSGSMPTGWAHRQLSTGRACVLVDGVDELSVTRREAMLRWLEDLVATYPAAHYIVTSRPEALKPERWLRWAEWASKERFDVARIQPMDAGQVDTFVDLWYEAIREELPPGHFRDALPTLADSLKGELRGNRSLRSLATIPLLCSLICALYRQTHQYLPPNRIELYRAAIDLLLTRRDREKGIVLPGLPTLDDASKMGLLQDFAYWMLKNDFAEVPLKRADERFATRLARMNPPIASSGAEARKYLVERTAIVREPSAGYLDFAHRSFQEYLAAKAALDDDEIQFLVGQAHKDPWQQTIVLAAGQARPKERAELLNGLLRRGDQEPEQRHRLTFLAVACLESGGELDRDIYQRITTAFAELLPPRDSEEAKAVAIVGDRAVPLLTARPGLETNIAVAAIEALGIIGSDAALSAIASFSNDERSPVIDQLWRTWDSFEDRAYARQVLAPIVKRTGEVRISSARGMAQIDEFPDVVRVAIDNAEQVGDLSPLAKSRRLTNLALAGGVDSRQLAVVGSLVRLKRLFMNQVAAPSLRPLEGLRRLEFLDLRNVSAEDTSDVVSRLTMLQTLKLMWVKPTPDLDRFSQLRRLADLDLTSLGLTSLEPLRQITSLRGLEIFRNEFQDWSPLSSLPELRVLIVSGSISNVSELPELPMLSDLTVFGSPQMRSLDGIERYEALKVLYVMDCPTLDDVSGVADLKHLRTIFLEDCPALRSLGRLADLSALEYLVLEGTQVRSVAALRRRGVDVEVSRPVRRRMTRGRVSATDDAS